MLQYFSGQHREDHLSDDYWDELEEVFKDSKELLKEASSKLSEQLF